MPDERARIGIFGLAGIEGWGHAADAAKTKAKDVDDTHNTHIYLPPARSEDEEPRVVCCNMVGSLVGTYPTVPLLLLLP